MIFHFSNGQLDMLQSCRRKTEFIALLKKARGGLDIKFKNTDSIVLDPKKNRVLEIRWMNDDTGVLQQNESSLTPVKRAIEIRVGSGVASSQVPVPPRPQTIESSNRPKLRALYDYEGNGVDELGFKAGDMIMMVSDAADGWYNGSLNGKSGYVPESYVEKVVGGKKKKKKANLSVPSSPSGGGSSSKSAWVELKTDEGEVYYYNEETDDSSWDPPPGWKSKAKKAGPPKAKKKKKAWSKILDDSSGDYYYYNEDTGESSWDPPPGY